MVGRSRRRSSSSAVGSPASACAKRLAKHGVAVSLVDRHDYNQFQPLLYQVATAQVDDVRHRAAAARACSPASPRRGDHGRHRRDRPGDEDGHERRRHHVRRRLSRRSRSGREPNFFHTPGAAEHAFPLYSVDDAERLRSRLLTVLEAAHRDPTTRRPRRAELRDRRRRGDRRRDCGCARRHASTA